MIQNAEIWMQACTNEYSAFTLMFYDYDSTRECNKLSGSPESEEKKLRPGSNIKPSYAEA